MTRQFGPEAHQRLNSIRAVLQGKRAWELYWGFGLSYRQIASATGLSLTTCWRRANLYGDWTLPMQWGRPLPLQLPPQRGTTRCPRGRPYIPGHDGPVEYRRPRHLVPGQRCTKTRRNGLPCQAWCQRGAFVCRVHGGAARQVQEAARRRVEELEKESREVDWRGRIDPGFHNAMLKIGAAERTLFVGADRRRRERAATRQRRLADPR